MTGHLIHQEISYQDPLRVLAHFRGQKGTVFLDSASQIPGCGRYSFIAIDPFQQLCSKNGHVVINGKKTPGDPFAILQAELARYSLVPQDLEIPFQGGVVGFWGYDLHQHLEKIEARTQDDMQFYDMVVGFYDLVIAFDTVEKRAWLFSSGLPLAGERRLQYANERLLWLMLELAQVVELPSLSKTVIEDHLIQSNFTRENYLAAVSAVKEYILAGDIFEANISQRFHTTLPEQITTLDLYRRLRKFNPAPFSAYLHFDEVTLLSASPERFLKLTGSQVETRPIKGTCPRGKTAEEDAALASALLQSEKDQAENIMIVDLLRNDLSRVCKPFSVVVPQLCGLESFPTVHHLVSVIKGELQAGQGAVDLLRATFPGGSITGAPKIRAMEIISEIEPTHRGPYCGAIGYIGFDGAMDTSITIRTFAIKDQTVTFQAGGAIVMDSDPLGEYEETLVKSKALRRALCESIIN